MYEIAEADRAILQKEIDTLTWWFRENAPEEIGHGSSVKSAISLLERLTKID